MLFGVQLYAMYIDIGNTETADGIPYRNCLDRYASSSYLYYALENAPWTVHEIATYLDQLAWLLWILETRSLHGSWCRSKLGFVFGVDFFLSVLEHGIERAQPFACEQADVCNQTADAACGECTSRETDEYDLITVFVIRVTLS